MGTELHLFAHATTWKAYWTSFIREYLSGDVLEVGAGIGTNTLLLQSPEQNRWVCVEPDRELLPALEVSLERMPKHASREIVVGTTRDLPERDKYDAILYIDVIEHIENDRAELDAVCKRLKPHGKLIILAPAHNWLFSPFDAAIGHYRRYNKPMMRKVIPDGLKPTFLHYLDSVGMLASLANRLLLRTPTPSPQQIQLWDKTLVPLSKVLDPLLGYRLGKSVLGVWEMEPR